MLRTVVSAPVNPPPPPLPAHSLHCHAECAIFACELFVVCPTLLTSKLKNATSGQVHLSLQQPDIINVNTSPTHN